MTAAEKNQRRTNSTIREESAMVDIKQDVAEVKRVVNAISSQVGKLIKDGEVNRIQLFGHPIEGETPHGRIPSIETELTEVKKSVRVLQEAAILGAGQKAERKDISSRAWAVIVLLTSLFCTYVGYVAAHHS